MITCWSCKREFEAGTKVCPYCGAAARAVVAPPAPAVQPAPAPPPSPAPSRPAPPPAPRRPPPPPPRQRTEFVLDEPATLRERATEATGYYAGKAASELGQISTIGELFRR